DTCLQDAIEVAEGGYAVSPMTASAWDGSTVRKASWATSVIPSELAPAPAPGARVRLDDLARTLRDVAAGGPGAFYRGRVAQAIASASWLEESDLERYDAAWVMPLRTWYREVEVAELPPPTQGVAALEALALLDQLEPTLENQIRCAGLALEDAHARVRDGADVADLLRPE